MYFQSMELFLEKNILTVNGCKMPNYMLDFTKGSQLKHENIDKYILILNHFRRFI